LPRKPYARDLLYFHHGLLDDDVVKETSLFLDTNWFLPNDHLTGAGDGTGTGQV